MIDIPSSKPIYILLIFLCSAFACQQSSDQPASIHTAGLQQLEPKLEFVISDSDEVLLLQVNAVTSDMNGNIYEIGRASCRERGYFYDGGVAVTLITVRIYM